MSWLIDTHVLIWLVGDSSRLREDARNAILDPHNEITVSLATIWEVAIKQAKGRLQGDAQVLLTGLPGYGFSLLPIKAEHIIATRDLPHHHGDPFDRLLIAQARIEGLSIITHDDAFKPYGVPILWT